MINKFPYLDPYLPYRGACGICGGADARHRIVDAVLDRYHAGESLEEIAEDLGLPLDAVILMKQKEVPAICL